MMYQINFVDGTKKVIVDEPIQPYQMRDDVDWIYNMSTNEVVPSKNNH